MDQKERKAAMRSEGTTDYPAGANITTTQNLKGGGGLDNQGSGDLTGGGGLDNQGSGDLTGGGGGGMEKKKEGKPAYDDKSSDK